MSDADHERIEKLRILIDSQPQDATEKERRELRELQHKYTYGDMA